MLKPLRTHSRTQYNPFAVSVPGGNRSQFSKVSEDPEVEGQSQWPTVSRIKMLVFFFNRCDWKKAPVPQREKHLLCVHPGLVLCTES